VIVALVIVSLIIITMIFSAVSSEASRYLVGTVKIPEVTETSPVLVVVSIAIFFVTSAACYGQHLLHLASDSLFP
jgi:hypothetical protein